MKAWTRRLVVDRLRYFRTLPIFLRASEAERQTLFIWVVIVRCRSKITPRLRASLAEATIWFSKVISAVEAERENRDEKWTTSVLDGLQVSLLVMHCSRLYNALCLHEGFIVMYSCESSAYIMQSRPCDLMTSWRGAKYNMNSSGPRTDPCGTPDVTFWGLDSVLPMTTFWERSNK